MEMKKLSANSQTSVSILPVFDLKLGAKIIGKNEETAKKMIKALVQVLPKDLEKIEAAYAERNFAKLQDLVHYTKGGASYCGTPRLKFFASKLHELLATNNEEAIQQAYEEFCFEIRAVINTYNKEIESV